MQSSTQNNYITGFDGLRAIAIIFIVAYHFSLSFAGGGFLGVDIFFVLSGYLVTSKILFSIEVTQDFRIGDFIKNRFRRIYPSLLLVIVSTLIYTFFFAHSLWTTVWQDSIASSTYTTNWWFIIHKLSYFDSFGKPSPLKHIWFLSVQEQFYLILPFLVVLFYKILRRFENLAYIIFLMALGSATLMFVLYNPEAITSRVYYGTDTRVFELLMGCWLAIVSPKGNFSFKRLSPKKRLLLNLISIFTLAIFILSAIFINEYNVFLYEGGMFLFSVNTVILLVCIRHPYGILGDILSMQPLKWIGTRSYAIYLWHFPIMVLSTPINEIGNPSYSRICIQLIITCIIAEFSYRFIETPFRRNRSRYISFNYGFGSDSVWGKFALAKKIATTAIIITVIAATAYKITTSGVADGINSNKQISTLSSPIPVSASETTTPAVVVKAKATKAAKPAKKAASKIKKVKAVVKSNNKVLAIGDSIMIDIAPDLKNDFSKITINGKVGRQMREAIKLASHYTSYNTSDSYVIIELGTNGYFTNKQINTLLDSFSNAHVFLVNTRVPRSWQNTVNDLLDQKASERDNVTLVDWYSMAMKHEEYFTPDGVHLIPSGSKALTKLIYDSITKSQTP